jgi:membrane-associated protease RseP (regulator of RpoE activity)
MRALAIFLFCFALAGAPHAQQQAKGWLGVELKDITKEEADALGWESPRGAKVVKLVPGGPAEKAGLLAGDVLISVDGAEADNIAAFIAAVSGKAPNSEVKLRLLRGGKEKRLAVTLGARPVGQARTEPKEVPILQLDTGGHMALIRGLAFTPDGKYIVSAGDDKLIRIWDWRAGKTVRTIRGQSGPGGLGTLGAMALSPNGSWLAAGGSFCSDKDFKSGDCREAIRLYDFASGELKALLTGHLNAVVGIAFSPDGNRHPLGCAEANALASARRPSQSRLCRRFHS